MLDRFDGWCHVHFFVYCLIARHTSCDHAPIGMQLARLAVADILHHCPSCIFRLGEVYVMLLAAELDQSSLWQVFSCLSPLIFISI